MTPSDTCELKAGVCSRAACGTFMASAQPVFHCSLQITCALQPSDGSGRCRGRTWPAERTSSQLHSSSFHEQTNEQSGKSPPGTGQTSLSCPDANKHVISITATHAYRILLLICSASVPARGAECERYPLQLQHPAAPTRWADECNCDIKVSDTMSEQKRDKSQPVSCGWLDRSGERGPLTA